MNKFFIPLFVFLLFGSVLGSLNMLQVKASTAEPYFTVEPNAVPPLYDANTTAYGLETPPTPVPVGQYFQVEIHVRNATATNVPAGVRGVEIHFYFGNILECCKPTGFVDMIGQPGGVLPEPPGTIQYSINAGFYDNADNPVTNPPYNGATQYMVAAWSNSGPWFNDDGLVATLTFQITYQPQSIYGETDFWAPLQIAEAGLIDGNGNGASFTIVQGALQVDSTPFLHPPGHDVGIRTIIASRTSICPTIASSIKITITVYTWQYPETFNLSAYANGVPVWSQNITQDSDKVSNINFTWEFSGLALGNYSLSAYAEPVPNETDTMDNNCTGSIVSLTILGDTNGDFTVNLQDLVLLANAYGSTPTSAKWNANADINNDNSVDLMDLVTLALHYGQHYP